jgi:hypothetical protein
MLFCDARGPTPHLSDRKSMQIAGFPTMESVPPCLSAERLKTLALSAVSRPYPRADEAEAISPNFAVIAANVAIAIHRGNLATPSSHRYLILSSSFIYNIGK